jgi:hypothetical protein
MWFQIFRCLEGDNSLSWGVSIQFLDLRPHHFLVLCYICFPSFCASLCVHKGFDCVWILVYVDKLYFGLDAIHHLTWCYVICLCMWTTKVVSANVIAYDTIFSNLIEKSSQFWPLKPHDCRGNNFMGKLGASKSSFQLHFSNKFNVE